MSLKVFVKCFLIISLLCFINCSNFKLIDYIKPIRDFTYESDGWSVVEGFVIDSTTMLPVHRCLVSIDSENIGINKECLIKNISGINYTRDDGYFAIWLEYKFLRKEKCQVPDYVTVKIPIVFKKKGYYKKIIYREIKLYNRNSKDFIYSNVPINKVGHVYIKKID